MKERAIAITLMLAAVSAVSAQTVELRDGEAGIRAGDTSVRAGDRKSSTVITGTQINRAIGAGATSEQSLGSETSIETRATVNSVHPGDAAAENYINRELDGFNFATRKLRGVAFTNASLIGANFHNADLRSADFTNADLSRANFAGANLQHAVLTNTALEDAILDGAQWTDGRTCAAGSRGICR